MNHPTWFRRVAAATILVTALVPVLLYFWMFGRAPALSADAALSLLNDPAQNAVLVDVRPAAEFDAMRVTGSVNWPARDIASGADLPAAFQGKTLILICNSGLQSAQAARRLLDLGADSVFYARGGLQRWVGLTISRPGLRFTEFTRAGQAAAPYQFMPLFEQVAVVVSGFGFKPLHMILSAVIGFILLKQKAFDLRTFGWGTLVFLAAEIFCAINYLVFNHDSYLAEYLHSYGMTLSFGIVTFALLHGLDERLLKFSAPDKRCAFLPLCRDCVKYNQVSCKLRTLVQVGMVAMAILAFIPILAQPQATSYATQILGSEYHYCRLLLNQYFETRYLPVLALIFSIAALLVLQRDKSNPAPLLARVFIAGALGAFGFSLFRLTLGSVFSQALIWADFWEEATELMFVALSAIVLWVYRDGLLDVGIHQIIAQRGAEHR